MARIIAGFADSLSLQVPKRGTRPTSDRVREAIFSALQARDLLDGARVVDLYAGSGALGLEAASRGASSVVLVERGAEAARLCRRNAQAVAARAPHDAAPRLDVAAAAVQAFLEGAAGPYDLAFLDPPYDLADDELARALTALAPLLSDGARVLVERSSRSPEPTWPEGLEPDKPRRYGETTLWWASTD